MHDAEGHQERVTPEAPKLNKDVFIAACAAKNALTDQQRADLLGMPRRAILRYIKGDVKPLLTTARRIANELDTSVDELWPVA